MKDGPGPRVCMRMAMLATGRLGRAQWMGGLLRRSSERSLQPAAPISCLRGPEDRRSIKRAQASALVRLAAASRAPPPGASAFACHGSGERVCKCQPLSALPRFFARLCRVWLFGSLVILLAFGASEKAHAAPLGPVRIVEAQGTVEVMRKRSGVWDPAHTAPPYNILYPDDQLRTGPNSRAMVMLSDQSVVRVGEAGHIQVLAAPRKRAGFSFLKGIFYFFHRDEPDELDLQTPTVSAVGPGTAFNLRVEDGRTVLSLLGGPVEMENEFGRGEMPSGGE